LWCGFVSDDIIYFIDNKFINTFDFETILRYGAIGYDYAPFRDLSFALDYRLWGENPFGFHLTSVLLFGVIVVVTRYFFVSLNSILCGGKTYENVDILSFLTALTVAVHPNHREVVYAVFNRGALLTVLFSICSVIMFVRFLSTEAKNRHYYYAVSIVLFISALMSREYSLTLPFAIAMLVFFDRRSKNKTMDRLSLVPFFVVSVIFFIVFRKFAIAGQYITQESSLISDLASKSSLAIKIVFFYLVRMFTSLGQINFEGSTSLTVLSVAVVGGLVFLSLWNRQKFPQLLYGLLFYLACLLPFLNVYKTLPIVSPRYSFLSCLGLFFILMSIPFVGRIRVVPFLCVCATFIWTMTTMYKTDYWKDNLTFWEFNAARENTSYVNKQLGYAYYSGKRYEKAFETLRSVQPATMDLKYYEVLGNTCFEIGNYRCAIQAYENMFNYDVSGDLAPSYLAKTYLKLGDRPNTEKYLEMSRRNFYHINENDMNTKEH
jgi:hypothetical protein